jgi:hypothetical protein
MPLTSVAECQDRGKVWNELAGTYNKMRSWNRDELKFMAPTETKLKPLKAPYTVRMASGDSGKVPTQDWPTGPGGQTITGNWRYVEIVGASNSGTVRVGKINDH